MTARVHPAIVLTVYAEELVVGARAAIFGNAALGLAEELAERGARLVHVYDSDAARVAEATAKRHDRTIFYAPLPESGDVGVRDGAFDLVIVPDLSLADDAGVLLALVRRVLSPAGAALIASPNTEASRPLIQVPRPEGALGYYELYEAVAEHFTSVRMIGQAPFVGYAVAEFSVEDPEPTIDSSLAASEGKEPDWFWALASDRNVRLDPFALIELPPDVAGRDEQVELELRTAPEAGQAPPPMESTRRGGEYPKDWAAEAPSTEGTVLADILEAEREAALDSLRQQEQAVQEERFRAEHAGRELAAAREELTLLRERCDMLKRSLEDEESRRAALEVDVENARQSSELALLRERIRTLEASAKTADDEHEADIARLEAQLKDRGREVQELKSEVTRRDLLVRELIASQVIASPDSPDNQAGDDPNGAVADLSAQLDRLAGEAARREADLVASKWKIAQLERELSQQR
jgi:hypothetical protein